MRYFYQGNLLTLEGWAHFLAQTPKFKDDNPEIILELLKKDPQEKIEQFWRWSVTSKSLIHSSTGEVHSLAEWAIKSDLDPRTIQFRLDNFWVVDLAIKGSRRTSRKPQLKSEVIIIGEMEAAA